MNEKQNEIVKKTSIIAVSACTTGVAHTFMAAKALEKEASKRGMAIKVQKNGSQGMIDVLSDAEISNADYVIIAADIKVDLTPFNGKKIYTTSTKQALSKASFIFDELENKAEVYYDASLTKNNKKSIKQNENLFKGNMNLYKHILTGISYMLPFVIAGGVITAISFFWGVFSFDPEHPEQYNKFAHSLKEIGAAGMGLMIPALAGYIAYSIGDRGAIVPGFVGGWLANNGFSGLTNLINGNEENITSGFLGAILAGLIAGYFIQFLKLSTKKIPQKFNSIKSMLIFPIIGSAVTGLIILWAINTPIGYIQGEINKGLSSIGGTESTSSIGSSIGLGIALGILIAVDFGGPFNKVAYLFGVADLAMHTELGTKSVIMAAVSAGCMMPPIAIGISVLLFPNKYTNSEKNTGYTDILLGLTHITEPAIAVAAKKPLINLPCFMIGSVISTVMSLLLGVSTSAPHGGVLVIMLVDKWYFWLLAIGTGSVVSGVLLGLTAKYDDIAEVKKPINWWIKFKKEIKFNYELKKLKLNQDQKNIKKQEFKGLLKQELALIQKQYIIDKNTFLEEMINDQNIENIEKINQRNTKKNLQISKKLESEKISKTEYDQLKLIIDQKKIKQLENESKDFEKLKKRYLKS